MRRFVAVWRANHQCRAENGLFAPQPQERRAGASAISLTRLVWRHRDRWSAAKSHVRVVGSSATLGRNPGYILVRVLDIARFAVDAVLRIDYEFWGTRFLNPFIDPGGAITRRRACEYVMFGFFLQSGVADMKVNRLIFFMISIG